MLKNTKTMLPSVIKLTRLAEKVKTFLSDSDAEIISEIEMEISELESDIKHSNTTPVSVFCEKFLQTNEKLFELFCENQKNYPKINPENNMGIFLDWNELENEIGTFYHQVRFFYNIGK